jgi:hypothetical protein
MKRFSIGTALEHAAAVCLVYLALGLVLTTSGAFGPARQGATLIGMGLAPVGVLALLGSYVAQTGPRRARWPALGGALVLGLLAVVGVAWRGLPELTAHERASLVLNHASGQPRLRHPFLGFSFAVPEGLEESAPGPEAPRDPRVHVQAWKDARRRRVLVVAVSRAHTRAEVTSFLDGMGAIEAPLGLGAAQVERDETLWEGGRREIHRRSRVQDVELHTDAFVTDYADARALAVVIVTVAPVGDPLGDAASTFVARGG